MRSATPIHRKTRPAGVRALCLAAGLLTLAGCAGIAPGRTLHPGSTRAEVIASQGPPRHVWPDADGGSTLEYSTQPFGDHCFMFKLDAGDKLLSFQDSLQPGVRNQVHAGMTMDEVSRLLGHERTRVFFSAAGEEVWDWTVPADTYSQGQRFNVHFKQGLVTRTSHSIVPRGMGVNGR